MALARPGNVITLKRPMPLYDYTSMDFQGHSQRGSREAVSLNELKHWMETHQLFLVSWHVHPGIEPEAVLPPPPDEKAPDATLVAELMTDLDKLPPLQRWWYKINVFFADPRHLGLLIGAIALLFVGNLVYLRFFAATNPFFAPTAAPAEGKRELDSIKVGMRREKVDKIFYKREILEKTPSLTRFRLETSFSVSVFFDATGGPDSPDNRVSAPPLFEIR